MSSKKDNFKLSNNKLMKFALQLASNQKYRTGINPSVGCVITKNNKILSYGSTESNGKPHAEVSAIKKQKIKNLKNSKMFVTLEPCSHYGKTPPCTISIIKSKINTVIFSHIDEDERTKNKSKKILNKKKIKVKSGLLNKEISKFYSDYDFIKKKNRPYVSSKLAVSSNNKILIDKTHITNKYSRDVAHILRYRNQALLTSYKTVNNDNPHLNCRLNGLEKYSPAIILIDKNLKINLNANLLKRNSSKIIVFHNSNNQTKIKKLKKKNTKLIKEKIINCSFDLHVILKRLYKLGYHRILLESGPKLINNFLNNDLINEFYLFKSDKKIISNKNINVNKLLEKFNLNFKTKHIKSFIGSDKLIHYF